MPKLLRRYLFAERHVAVMIRTRMAWEIMYERRWAGKFIDPDGPRARRYRRIQHQRRRLVIFFYTKWPNSEEFF